jgi:VanZ family protein
VAKPSKDNDEARRRVSWNRTNATADLAPAYRCLWVAWMLALVYGSLLPLEFRGPAWDDVMRPFLQPLLAVAQHRSMTDWVTNVAIFLPLGYFWAASASQVGSHKGQLPTIASLGIWAACVALSVCIEFSQSFFAMRDPSSADILANAMGALFGIAMRHITGAPVDRLVSGVLCASALPPRTAAGGRAALLAAALCAAWLVLWAGLLTPHSSSAAQLADRWQSLQWLPFVHHQAADIILAFTSTAIAAAAFAPIGVALWWHGAFAAKPWRTRVWRSAGVAAVAALGLEACKLVWTTKTPDSGNIAIAALSAGLAYWLSPLIWLRLRRPQAPVSATAIATIIHAPPPERDHMEPAQRYAPATRPLVAKVCAVLSAIAVVALVRHYPITPLLLAAGIAVYAVVLLRYPLAWLVVLPALLPVLDLAPWTGWHAVDELDAFILATLAIGLWRLPHRADRPRNAGWGFWLPFAGCCGSMLISALHGMWPLQAIDTNALGNPSDHYAGLGLAKALVLASGLALLIRGQSASATAIRSALGAGVVLGLVGASITVMIERLAYAGLTDFSATYRAVGMFSTMQTGGAHLDAYLLFAMPFAGIWALQTRNRWQRLLALASIAAGSYAVMMTFSRTAIAALTLQALVLAVFAARDTLRSRPRITGVMTTLVAVVAIVGTIISPALFGTFMQSRVAGTDADMQTRSAHWSGSHAMMTDSWPVKLFGMGVGSFARTYQLLGPPSLRPAVHRFVSEDDNTFLRIHPGATVYVEQIVSVSPGQTYAVSLKARAHGPDSAVNLLLCDRTLLQGYGCQSVSFHWTGDEQTWRTLKGTLHSGSVGANRLRTSKLSLENAGRGSAVDLDEIRLVDAAGNDKLHNGDFQAGANRWDFSSPFNHLPWHIKNIGLEVLFNQGWVGVLLFTAMVVATAGRLLRLAQQGSPAAMAMFASLMGLLGVGAFDSILDAPRLVMVVVVLIAMAGLMEKPLPHRRRHMPQPATPRTTAVDTAPVEPLAAHVRTEPDVSRAPVHPPAPAPWRVSMRSLALHVLALAVCVGVVTRLPFVPYNVRELVNPFHPVIGIGLLALAIFWIFGLPALAARWLVRTGAPAAGFPVLLIAHALAGWVLLRYAVLPESIHDVVGSPVLDWPWDFEIMVRMVALLSAAALPLTAGAVLARMALRHPVGLAPTWLLLSYILAMPLQYTAIVTWAATDNLTELMADNGSVSSFVTLQLYGLLMGTIASLAGLLHDNRTWRPAAVVLTGLLISLPAGYWLLSSGTEPVLIKQDNVFSALQFLFSTDRNHYAQGPALLMRFAVFHVGAVMLIAWAQWPFNTSGDARPSALRRHASG